MSWYGGEVLVEGFSNRNPAGVGGPELAPALARRSARHASGSVGRMANFPTWLGFAGEPQLKHVHADRRGNRHSILIQPRRDNHSWHLPGIVSWAWRRSGGLLRTRRRHRHVSLAGAGTGIARAQPNQQRHQITARIDAQNREAHSP